MYEYIKSLGGGGFSKVYLVRHKYLDERVLKIMDCNFLLQLLEKENIEESKQEFEKIKKRFIMEAQLYKKINHSNIIKIYDIDLVDVEDKDEKIEIPFLVMPYIKGTTLKKIIKSKAPLDFKTVFKICTNILPALDTIHKEGIIHRDIKPANIMIEEKSGCAILIDFGMAKDTLNEITITTTKIPMGTPKYMSPEQFTEPKELESAADIYAFGIVLFEMLTGEVPYKGRNYLEIIHGHCDKTIPNIRLKKPGLDLPPGIEDIIFKALDKNPDGRYKTAEDFLSDIKTLKEDHEEIDRKESDQKIEIKIKKEEEIKIESVNKKEKDQDTQQVLEKEDTEKLDKNIQEGDTLDVDEPPGKDAPKSIELDDEKGVDEEDKKESEIQEKKNIYKKKPEGGYRYLIYLFGVIFIAAFIIFDPLGIMPGKSKVKIDYTEKIEEMRGDFQRLTAFLKGEESNKDKLGKCREFLAKHQNLPGNNEKDSMVSATNKYIEQLDEEINVEKEYQKFIAAAKGSIQNKDYETAIGFLEKAKAIRDTEEIKNLLAEITGKKIDVMKGDFNDLKAFLNGNASNKDKLGKCQKFLGKHQDLPENSEKDAMFLEIRNLMTQLETEIGKDEQYQICIDTAKEYTKNGEYQKALDELEKAKKIKDTEEIAALSKEIRNKQKIEIMKGDFNNLKQFLEGDATKKEKMEECQDFLEKHKNTPDNKAMVDKVNQFISQLKIKIREDDDYNTIKDKPTRIKYLAFKRKYPNSDHLRVLRFRIMIKDKNLPPEYYWNKPIKKNAKGYYQYTFGKKHNGHIMIYIPEKKIWIDKYEVSWKQYRGYLAAEGKRVPPIKKKVFKREEDEYPVFTTYAEAVQYCKRYGLRLPNETEWEYAAGKRIFTYPWDNELPDANETYRANYVSFDDGFKGTAPVKSFEKFSSPIGAVNMAGNVWEWVTGSILKGGGFTSDKKELAIKNKIKAAGEEKKGFRCIKEER